MKHVAVMSFTASIGLMAIFFVDFVDMIFISMLGQAELAAAIGYAGAILFFTISVSIGISIACGALVARAIGAGDMQAARRKATNVMVSGLIVSVLVVALVWLNLRAALTLVGAHGETLELAATYLSIIIPSVPVLMLGMAGSAVLRAYGDARRAMMATLVGGAVNAVLDPILIFGLGLDLSGAAIASVISRFAIMAMALYPVFKHYDGFAPFSVLHFIKDLRPVFAIAFPAILANVATPVGSAYITRQMAAFGEEAVAGMAIVGRLTPVAFAVIFALSGAIGPIIGQNFGAGAHDRVRKAFGEGLVFTACYVFVAAVILYVFQSQIAALFNATGLARELVFLFCGPLALAYFFNGVIFVGNATFNNLNHPFYSTYVNWGRNTLGTIPFAALGAFILGAPGVLIGQAAGGAVFALISWMLARRIMDMQSDIAPVRIGQFTHRARLMQLFGQRR